MGDDLLELLKNGDVCGLFFLALLLGAIGRHMVASLPTLDLWGYRLAAGSFVIFGLYQLTLIHEPAVSDLIMIVIRALLAAGLAAGLAWIALAVASHTLAAPLAKFREFRHTSEDERAKRRAASDEEERCRREQLEWERTRPERERAEREAQARASDERDQRSQAQKRRELARMDCELLWIAYAPAIQHQFGKQDFEAFFTKYMGDSQPPEFVEERAEAIKTTLTTLYTNAEPTKKYKSIEEAISGFDRAKERIAQEHFEDPEYQEYLKLELDKVKAQHLAAVIKNLGA